MSLLTLVTSLRSGDVIEYTPFAENVTERLTLDEVIVGARYVVASTFEGRNLQMFKDARALVVASTCTQYQGHNTECGDDAEQVRGGFWYCDRHADWIDQMERVQAEMDADPAYQAGAANGWAEA